MGLMRACLALAELRHLRLLRIVRLERWTCSGVLGSTPSRAAGTIEQVVGVSTLSSWLRPEGPRALWFTLRGFG
jgi:hypothetical protein